MSSTLASACLLSLCLCNDLYESNAISLATKSRTLTFVRTTMALMTLFRCRVKKIKQLTRRRPSPDQGGAQRLSLNIRFMRFFCVFWFLLQRVVVALYSLTKVSLRARVCGPRLKPDAAKMTWAETQPSCPRRRDIRHDDTRFNATDQNIYVIAIELFLPLCQVSSRCSLSRNVDGSDCKNGLVKSRV